MKMLLKSCRRRQTALPRVRCRLVGRCTCREGVRVLKRGCAAAERYPAAAAAARFAYNVLLSSLPGAQCECTKKRHLRCTCHVDAGRPRTPGPLERGLSQRGGAGGGLARSSVPALQLGRASQGPATLARRTMGARAAGQAGAPGTHPNLNLAWRSSMAGGLRRVSTRPLALDTGDVAAEILPPSSPGGAHFQKR